MKAHKPSFAFSQTTSSEPLERPVHEILVGRVKAAIWSNETPNGTRFNVTIVKLYKYGEEWRQTKGLGRDDLPPLVKVADQAHTWCYNQ